MGQRAVFIDFLRGLSVLGILFYHIVPGTPIGLGQGSMEFFFVISGYLITRTFARRLSQGFAGLKDFASSRARRLLPTLCLYVALIIIVNLAKGKSVQLVFASSFWTLLGFYNWFHIFSTETIRGLGGIWSLSIEDQYYYLMLTAGGLLLLFRTKKLGAAFFALYIFMAISSLVMRIYNAGYVDYSLGWISYNTISRLWGFSCGGVAASILALQIGKGGVHRSRMLNFAVAVIAFFAAYVSLLSVKAYNAQAFLTGWLYAPFLLSVCIYALFQVSTGKEASGKGCKNLNHAKAFLNRDLFTSSMRLLSILFIFISKVGVACYPIYLFQESDGLLGIRVHWTFSLGWALVIGFAVHNLWERRFYAFPKYHYLEYLSERPS